VNFVGIAVNVKSDKENIISLKKYIKAKLHWDDFRIQRFLSQPNPRFGGCKPVDLIRTAPEMMIPAIKGCCDQKTLNTFEVPVHEQRN
jgi:hypothetical protein